MRWSDQQTGKIMDSDFKLSPPHKITVVDSIIEQIVASIQDGNILPGDKLPSERHLIEMLGVSRSSVREALQGLAAMDLVETRPGEGTFVKEQHAGLLISGKQIGQLSSELQMEMRHHLNQSRLILESEILALAALNINPQSAAEIKKAWEDLNRCEQETILYASKMVWKKHDNFHLVFARASGNPFLVQILKSLIMIVPESLRDKKLTYGDQEENKRVFSAYEVIHRNMCRAVLEGNPENARRWMKHHYEYEEINIKCFDGVGDLKQLEDFETMLQEFANVTLEM